jgi:hypothetical protein
VFRRIAQASKVVVPAVVTVWTAGLVVAPVIAQERSERAEFAVKLARASSDNIRRASINEQSGSYTAAGFIAGFGRDGTRFDATLDADLEQRDYSVGSIEDDLYGTLDGLIDFAFVPDRFSWYAEENLGQTRISPFLPDSPDNREQVKSFSTGPRLTLPVGMRTALELGATRSSVSYDETSLLDRDADSIDAALVRTLANQARVSVVLNETDIEYERPDLDAELTAGYLRYDRELATGSAQLGLGSNRVEFTGDRKSSEPFILLGWARDVGSFSRIELTAVNRLVDAAESFRQTSPEDRLDDVFATADVFAQTLLRAVYSLERPRASWVFGLSEEEQAYETVLQLDSDQTQFDVTYTRRLSESLAVSFGAYRAERKFVRSGQVDDDEGTQVSLSKLFGTAFELEFSYTRTSRDGVSLGVYDESVARLELLYHIGGRPDAGLPDDRLRD